MRFIPTIVHGLLDYLYVVLLLFIPYIFNFSSNDADSYVLDIAASAVLVYSLFTNYELGFFKSIPMRTHLLFDLILGIVIAVSPWIFGFADKIYLPHLFLGLFSIVASVFSKTSSKQIEKSAYSRNTY
jgi:hypothetical protein